MKTKTPTKKTISKKAAKKQAVPAIKFVTRAPSELAFWTIDGQSFHTLEELMTGLLAMAGRVYRYHADKDHQDFAVWVAAVFHNKTLAKELKTATTAKIAAKLIKASVAANKT